MRTRSGPANSIACVGKRWRRGRSCAKPEEDAKRDFAERMARSEDNNNNQLGFALRRESGRPFWSRFANSDQCCENYDAKGRAGRREIEEERAVSRHGCENPKRLDRTYFGGSMGWRLGSLGQRQVWTLPVLAESWASRLREVLEGCAASSPELFQRYHARCAALRCEVAVPHSANTVETFAAKTNERLLYRD